MKIIGVTGPSGAGKGEICKLFEKNNIPCIDTDNIYHQLLTPPSPCLDALVRIFGQTILNTDKTLNRKQLAKIVFKDKKLLETLNIITHKFIIEKTRNVLCDLESKGFTLAVVDAPLLFESGFDSECDVTISVLAERDLRKSRIIARDKLTEAEAEKRINSQNSDEFYTEKSNYVIYNNGDRNEFVSNFYDILNSIGENE